MSKSSSQPIPRLGRNTRVNLSNSMLNFVTFYDVQQAGQSTQPDHPVVPPRQVTQPDQGASQQAQVEPLIQQIEDVQLLNTEQAGTVAAMDIEQAAMEWILSRQLQWQLWR